MIQRLGSLAVVLFASCGGSTPAPAPAPAPAPVADPVPAPTEGPTSAGPVDIVAAWDDLDPNAPYSTCYVMCADGVALVFMAACADASVSVFVGAVEYTYKGNTFVIVGEEASPSVVENTEDGVVTFTESAGAVMRLRRTNVAPGPICEATAAAADVASGPDHDGDGLPDAIDNCPDMVEDYDGFEDIDGCPDPDNDRDGISDMNDKCPNEPEDVDGMNDGDGCPEGNTADRDGDGVADMNDKCPDDPEDYDGFQDADGCPDMDNDADGILDVDDLCPNDPENRNGREDLDGCPER